jgi:hypothetical protein
MYENQNARPHGNSETTLQDLSSGGDHHRPGEQQQNRPNEPISQRPSLKSAGASEPPTPLPEDPHQHENDRQCKGQPGQVYGHTGGVGKSRTELQNNPGDRNRSRRDVSGQDSRELFICELVLDVTETNAGLDLNRDLKEDGEGKYWYNRQRGGRGASRVSLFELSLGPYLTSIKVLV